MSGKAIIFSAPSGSGKTTIVRHLLSAYPSLLDFSISATSRPPRGTEIDNKDYYFISQESFRDKIINNEFAEFEEVYNGDFYGTLKSEIDRVWKAGKNVIFDVDVQGGLKLKKYFGENALAVFVKVPHLEILEHRLRYRNTDSEDKIRQRLEKAKHEITFKDLFDMELENDNAEEALKKAEKMVLEFLKQ